MEFQCRTCTHVESAKGNPSSVVKELARTIDCCQNPDYEYAGSTPNPSD